MAALGFSVLMREWRRGMAFDPWHGSLYLSLSAVITLSLSPPLATMDGETELHHWIWSAQSGTLHPFWGSGPLPLAHTHNLRDTSLYQYHLITKLKKRKQAEADLWKYYFICRALPWASQVIMLQFHIICLSKPHKSLHGSSRKSCYSCTLTPSQRR